MYEIDKKIRDTIIQFLSNLVVPSQVGAGIMQVVEILKKLKEVEPKKEESEPKKK